MAIRLTATLLVNRADLEAQGLSAGDDALLEKEVGDFLTRTLPVGLKGNVNVTVTRNVKKDRAPK